MLRSCCFSICGLTSTYICGELVALVEAAPPWLRTKVRSHSMGRGSASWSRLTSVWCHSMSGGHPSLSLLSFTHRTEVRCHSMSRGYASFSLLSCVHRTEVRCHSMGRGYASCSLLSFLSLWNLFQSREAYFLPGVP